MPEKLDCLKEADNLFTNTKEVNFKRYLAQWKLLNSKSRY
jgi:hypothetical protein